jgi:hypothetical protein
MQKQDGVRTRGLSALVDWLSQYQAFWKERLERLRELLKEVDK